ncbi:MAG: hypothetical protein ACXW3T_14530, partial [Rhodoplanes sp.]
MAACPSGTILFGTRSTRAARKSNRISELSSRSQGFLGLFHAAQRRSAVHEPAHAPPFHEPAPDVA